MKEEFYSTHNFNFYRRNIVPKKYPHVEIVHCRVDGNPKGGMTSVRLWIIKGCLITGVAFCCDKDTYNKKKGRSIACGRLMRALMGFGLSLKDYWRIHRFVRKKTGIVDKFYFRAAYRGDHIV